MPRPYISTVQLQQIINQNKHLFVLGNTIHNDWLCTTFNIEQPVLTATMSYEDTAYRINKFNLTRAYWYTRLNKILCDYGIVIRQQTNTNTKVVSYVVQNAAGVFERLNTYVRIQEVKRVQYERLNNGYRTKRGRLPRRGVTL